MKTIELKLYDFSELNQEAQNNAINVIREQICTDFIYDDAYQTVKQFNSVFGTKEGRNSWLDINTSNIEDDILQLQGLRLQKYLWNNFNTELFKGKYYSLWSKKDVSFKHYKDGYPVLKSRHSKVLKENSCVLTGMCYDEDILQPIYDFLQKRDFSNCTINYESLLNDCIDQLSKTVENELDYRNSDEGVIEEINNNDYDFTFNGKLY